MKLHDDDGAPAPWLFKALLVALAVQLLLLFLLPGCAHVPSGPPPAPPPLVMTPQCDGDYSPRDVDVCDGKFTAEGLPCVLCDVPRACFLPSIGVYCTPSCRDPYCGVEP